VRQKDGCLFTDNKHIDWRKNKRRRKKSMQKIIFYALWLFDENDYDLLSNNCQHFA
jgi:hypothetical protein